jgi:hypothetical protein
MPSTPSSTKRMHYKAAAIALVNNLTRITWTRNRGFEAILLVPVTA